MVREIHKNLYSYPCLLCATENNERVHFNLGMLAMDDRNTAEAEHWFRRAVHLKHDFRSALFNLALLLADDQRPLEAAPFLNQLVKHHPEHIKGLILLGDIYINNIKDLDAAEMVSVGVGVGCWWVHERPSEPVFVDGSNCKHWLRIFAHTHSIYLLLCYAC